MSSLTPRSPYSKEELEKLYPKDLQLQLVQILLRHGERSPVSPRFRNAGLHPYWPYCNAARRMRGVILGSEDHSKWDVMEYRRRLETFGQDDGPIVASGPGSEFDSICQPGELTDKGRETTLALGERLRHLYVEQLKFMPRLISDSDMIYLRATPLPRALESVEQTFWGFYPPSARTADFPPPTILTRSPADETLYPNDGNCRRFAQVTRAFAQRTADRWNDTSDMAYLTRLIGKWMPDDSNRVAVDSHPRLSGIMDTINSTLAHGPETRLPKEFYDKKAAEIIDRIGVEEWFSGYAESREYRMLGIGGLMGDVVGRMAGSVERRGNDGLVQIGGENGELGKGRGGETNIKFALSGCHDTTLAGVLSSLGAFDGEKWPPYTSHIAFELFQKEPLPAPSIAPGQTSANDNALPAAKQTQSWWSSLFGSTKSIRNASVLKPEGMSRKTVDELTENERQKLNGYFVRVRYNDRVMTIPGCKNAGNHLEGDESFCTLEAFKAIVDKYTPKHWKKACITNLDEPAFPEKPEPGGY
ncbi:phosphoglycerate mutase-like protein [Rhizodiscina lignyota]|uniref:3-phytase n=1 Tax=Rhizodiscina lignyota TaxID=1504668 RepID=A0A9P4IPS5_9PEZI|nr:phosphoglycerate mutase-like protein [Rhizodiscina lignyota]